jgi:predicted DNA-binding transcriptional regulator YafY
VLAEDPDKTPADVSRELHIPVRTVERDLAALRGVYGDRRTPRFGDPVDVDQLQAARIGRRSS